MCVCGCVCVCVCVLSLVCRAPLLWRLRSTMRSTMRLVSWFGGTCVLRSPRCVCVCVCGGGWRLVVLSLDISGFHRSFDWVCSVTFVANDSLDNVCVCECVCGCPGRVNKGPRGRGRRVCLVRSPSRSTLTFAHSQILANGLRQSRIRGVKNNTIWSVVQVCMNIACLSSCACARVWSWRRRAGVRLRLCVCVCVCVC